MKRPPPQFVVEVRRQRRSTNGGGKSWLEDPRFAAATAGGLAAAAVFERAPEPAPAPAPSAPARPQGRILPSLVEPVAPPPPQPEEPAAKPRAASPARRARRIAEADGEAAELKPTSFKLAERASRPRVAKPKAAPAPEAAPPRDGAIVKMLAETLVARSVAAPKAEPAGDVSSQAESRQARHRRILERYVRGGALKPGERWKRRLHKGRD